MKTPSPASCGAASLGRPEVSFGRSADDLAVARVGDTAFAMAPARDGRHYLVTAWRLSRPIAEWTRNDFYSHSGETLGGKRVTGTEERRFLVPPGEYRVGPFGFVIDPDQHEIYGGPSDFIGWRPGRAA